MIRKIRRKIIRLLIIIYSFLMLAAVLLIYVVYHKDNCMLVSRSLTQQINNLKEFENQDASGSFSDKEKPLDNTMPPAEEEYDLSKETCIYTVLKHNEELSVYYTRGRKKLNDEDIITAADGILSGKRRSGTWDHYQYEITIWDYDLIIAFADITLFFERERTLVLISAAGALILTAAWALLSIWLSGKLVLPLKEAYEKQSDFILAAEHELKTPLSVLKTSLDLLRKDGVESKYLNYAEEETENMARLVSEMLEVSELDIDSACKSCAGIEDLIDFDLGNCIESAVLPFEATAYENNICLKIRTDDGLIIYGNEDRISRLGVILVDNALKHTPDGCTTEVSVSGQKHQAKLSVRNQGDEIPTSERDRIFERFYRVDKSRNRSEGRFGLGLSIARKIAHEHHTEIRVSSGGGWTEFYVVFNRKMQNK